LDDGLHEAAFEKINGDYKTSWRRGCGFIRAAWGLRGLPAFVGWVFVGARFIAPFMRRCVVRAWLGLMNQAPTNMAQTVDSDSEIGLILGQASLSNAQLMGVIL
jgi:hypothetical protein